MTNALVPAQAGGALGPVGQSKGIVAPTAGMLGGGKGFGDTWGVNKDVHKFVKRNGGESRDALYILVDEMHPTRGLFPKSGPDEGKRVCWSDDALASHIGVACVSCPHVAQVDEYNKYYESHPEIARPATGWVGDCALRYAIYFYKEIFVEADGTLTLRTHEQRALVNVPESSIYALWSKRNPLGYMGKLAEANLNVQAVVTKLSVKQRERKATKTLYDYADFENLGTYESLIPKIAREVFIKAEEQGDSMAPTAGAARGGFPPVSAPAASPAAFPPPPASGFTPPAAATGGFVPPTASAAPGFPPAGPAATVGFGGAVPTSPAPAAPAAAPGFPPATAFAAPPPAAAPGFPPATPFAAAPPAAAPAAPVMDFMEMARVKLVADFHALEESMKPIVLGVLGVASIDLIPKDRAPWASQAVNQAKGATATPVTGAPAVVNPF